jgi:hypothetical protein
MCAAMAGTGTRSLLVPDVLPGDLAVVAQRVGEPVVHVIPYLVPAGGQGGQPAP